MNDACVCPVKNQGKERPCGQESSGYRAQEQGWRPVCTWSLLPLERRYNHWGFSVLLLSASHNLEFLFSLQFSCATQKLRLAGILVESIKYPGSEPSDTIAYANTNLTQRSTALFMYYLKISVWYGCRHWKSFS